jgi:hypothetical protein
MLHGALIDKKREIYGQIAAFRVSCEGFPQFNLNNSFPSIDNCSNSLDFLIDLLKATVGFEVLTDILTKTLTFEIPKIELAIKKALKIELKRLVSCGVNPSIPDFFKHQSFIPSSVGVDLDLKKVDYLNVMLVDPSSTEGFLIYDDVNGGLNSQDYHTYLYETVQLDGTQTNWGSQTLGSPNDVLSVEFNSSGPPNNILNVKASPYYSNPSNNKKLTDLNNDYIDSISLFGSAKMINDLVDGLFGSISFSLEKTPEQIKKELEIENIIECILNTDDGDIIDNSFFTFSNESNQIHEQEAFNRSKGVRVLANCGNVASTVDIEILTAATNNIITAQTQEDKIQAIDSAIKSIADNMSETVDEKNKLTAKLSFIDFAIKKLMIKMGNVILSPKVITIFAVNHYIVYGVNLEDPIDWIRKNSNLMKAILEAIRETIINILLNELLKELKEIIKCHAQKIAIEYAKAQAAQLASLVGIPQDVLRMIQGLN